MVARARNGDTEAFSQLVRKHSARTRRLVQRLVRNDADVDDVLQTVFIEAFRSIRNFDGRACFSTWLSRIAIRMSARLASGTPLEVIPVEESDVISVGMGPDQIADAREGSARLDRLVAELPVTQQQAFVLNVMDERSAESTATVLQTTASAIRVRVFKARQALTRRMRSDTWFSSARRRTPSTVR